MTNFRCSTKLGISCAARWCAAGVLTVALGGQAASAQQNDGNERWELTFRSFDNTVISSGEAGSENEFFGFVQAVPIGAGISAWGGIRGPNSGSPQGNVLWSVVEPKDKSTRTFDTKEGLAYPIGTSIFYSIDRDKVADAALLLLTGLWEDDVSSADDFFGAPQKYLKFEEGQDDITILLKNGDDQVSMVFSLKRAPPERMTGSTVATPRANLPKGVNILDLAPVTQTISYGPYAAQTPEIKLTVKGTLAQDRADDAYLLIDLTGSTVSASTDGVIDLDQKGERGFFLEIRLHADFAGRAVQTDRRLRREGPDRRRVTRSGRRNLRDSAETRRGHAGQYHPLHSVQGKLQQFQRHAADRTAIVAARV